MIIPFSTDAPIYHFPKATLGVIASNVVIHLLWSYMPPETAEPYAMKLGSGLHPIQWLSHNFLHADFLHLFFNMVFLWSYGIVVEGKIGWLPFLMSYLSIGTLHGAMIQAAYLRADKPSYVLGASAIVFGLMAVAMIWAPVNELSCMYLFIGGFRVAAGVVELRIYVFALLQLALEGLSAVFQFVIHGDPMSSGLLHISGALWGVILGTLLVKTRWVDCENWDVFSLLTKRRALKKAWEARGARLDRSKDNERPSKSSLREEDRAGLSTPERAAKLRSRLHRAIEAGDVLTAQTDYQKWMAASGDRAPREELLEVIKALHEKEGWAASVPAMRALCRLYPERSEKVRLKLASLLIKNLERPTEGRSHLNQIRDENLDVAHQRYRQKLLKDAEQMIEEGMLEVQEDE